MDQGASALLAERVRTPVRERADGTGARRGAARNSATGAGAVLRRRPGHMGTAVSTCSRSLSSVAPDVDRRRPDDASASRAARLLPAVLVPRTLPSVRVP